MIQLKVRLTGKAEEGFRELLNKTRSNEYDIVADALALLHCAVEETIGGKKVAIYNPETKEATIISSPILNRLG